MRAVPIGLLVAATVLTGLIAGLFFAYAVSVMPALAGSDDETFVDTMQRINVAIQNVWFGTVFGGALVAAVAVTVVNVSAGPTHVTGWVVAGLVLYVVVVVVTSVVNVPLNTALASAGAGDADSLSTARTAFESRWVTYNLVRCVGSVASFGCFVGALARR